LIRNLIYCGKIFVTKYKDQESRLVKKLHEPLISEGLFNNVTDFLVTKDKHSIEKLLNIGIDNLIKMNQGYVDMDLSEARSLIGLVYPEILQFKKIKYKPLESTQLWSLFN
jgi:hypothetical protein